MVKTLGFIPGSRLMNLQRQLGSKVGKTRCVTADAEAVVSRSQIIAGPADPVQPVTDSINDHLVTADVAQSIFPGDKIGNGSQLFNHGGTKVSPISRIDKHPQRSCRGNGTVVLPHSFIICIWIIRWESEDAINASRCGLLCNFHGKFLTKS